MQQTKPKSIIFPICFCFIFFFLALLIKMASSPSYLLETPRPFPVFLTLPSPSPCQMKGLFWAEAGFTPSHSHYLSSVSCHRPVCPLILHGQMWTGWGRRILFGLVFWFFVFFVFFLIGRETRTRLGGAFDTPSSKAASCWTCSSRRDTRQN